MRRDLREKSRLLSFLILLSLALAACGGAATPAATEAPQAPPTEALAAAPTVAPTEAPTAEPTAAPTEPPTAEPTTAPPPEGTPKTLRLPDLKGRTVAAVTENAYTPLNFVDPATGKAVGWEYDAVNEICRRLNCAVDWQVTSWDAMIAAVKEGQFDVGMDGITINDERKQQVDFSDPLHDLPAVHAGARRRRPLHHARRVRRRPQAADRLAGRHHQLLHRRLQRPGRRRSQPAHQALRELRRIRPGAASPATSTWS